MILLGDVGPHELGAEDYCTSLRFLGHDAVGIGVLQLPTANALDVDRNVKKELARLSRRFPPGCSTTWPSTRPRPSAIRFARC